MDFKESLNLPKTNFPMRADLAGREPQFLQRWEEADLYQSLLERRKEAPEFLLHDGPPYANGHIHIGHVLNKVLKDFVVKYKTMSGYRCEFIPGWDCHGLPIELQVDRKLGAEKEKIGAGDFRRRCRDYAIEFVGKQRDEFKRLAVFGEWEAPYLTMDYRYEGTIARELAAVLEGGGLYRGKKPVYWCASCQTALAEAEVEYEQHVSPSIYVAFNLNNTPADLQEMAGGKPVALTIWTTTPWTIPANLAVALHPDASYCLLDAGDRALVVAEVLADFVARAAGLEEVRILGRFKADKLKGATVRHPLYERDSKVLTADFVTMDTGSGCVHIAPGHGADDYELGRANGLEAYAPVDDRGRYTSQVPQWEGMPVLKANPHVVEELQQVGALLNKPGETVDHTYPHCWRCKKPIVFRATEQWFISMAANDLRGRALKAVEDEITFVPRWGKERMRGMLENRPDWCISRQRSWGVPIPAAYCLDCGEVLLTPEIVRHVADIFTQHGADVWFEWEPARLLPPGTRCPSESCGGNNFGLEKDILDVWWDSGVSWSAVLEERLGKSIPCDLYLEGSDQHRGWFQSSLIAGLSTRGKSPYTTVLTHGFTVDGNGRKMSKSLGNVVSPDKIISRNGAELLRLWVAAEDYRDDVRISNEIVTRLTEAYRKIRNTFRFLLGNLYDFNPETDMVATEEMLDLDRWALGRLQVYLERVRRAYDGYEFHQIYHSTIELCSRDLSSFYLDVIKDRIYASKPDGLLRRSAQTVMWQYANSLVRVLAPVLAFTAEDVWDHLPRSGDGDVESVHLADFPGAAMGLVDGERQDRYQRLMEMRDQVLKALEEARREKTIGSSLEAVVTIRSTREQSQFLSSFGRETLADLFIVSGIDLEETAVLSGDDGTGAGGQPLDVKVSRSGRVKCERCWRHVVEPLPEGSPETAICGRCLEVIA